MPGGQPSMMQPMAGPWDSPKLVTAKRVPKVLPDIWLLILRVTSEQLADFVLIFGLQY
jgi:hypothetical protein